jgi:hypothetical protein
MHSMVELRSKKVKKFFSKLDATISERFVAMSHSNLKLFLADKLFLVFVGLHCMLKRLEVGPIR